jgi:hypothetical protein
MLPLRAGEHGRRPIAEALRGASEQPGQRSAARR